jgi:hypothetical protein
MIPASRRAAPLDAAVVASRTWTSWVGRPMVAAQGAGGGHLIDPPGQDTG